MKHRQRMSRSHSRSVFRKGADRLHYLNTAFGYRGGFRF